MKNAGAILPRGFLVCLKKASFIIFLLPLFLSAQGERDVIKDYVGWAGNPDSLTVFIDPSFSDQEKDSIREAMKRWNNADSKPKFKEVSEKPAKIVIKEGDPGKSEDGTDNAGIAGIDTDGDGKVTSVEIIIRNNPNPGLKETATHELGHSIGLDDTDATANPGDVMKGTGDSNGTDGNLSKHDSTEMRAAAKSITTPSPAGNIPKKKRALAPPVAIEPGQNGILQFDLGFPFPPTTTVNVVSAGDPLLLVNSFNLLGNLLTVQVALLPGHGSGQFYLDIQVHPPLPDPPVSYLGYHFVHSNPVEPLTFQCPCEIFEEAGRVHINWKEHHNYPYDNPLRAHLLVDGNRNFLARGGGDFTIDLNPGVHIFELSVDDFQVNNCSFSTSYPVIGSPLVPIRNWAIFISILLIMVLAWFRLRGSNGH
jgi:hypothetical protein